MGRANRLNHGQSQAGVFHVTHRCHDQAFLLKFARDRDALRTKLREHVGKFEVSLLDYCITSNHVHFLLDAPDRLELSRFMREVAGEFAQAYNRRKKRTNAFWGDTYHATLVEDGEYLWQCLCYIELNMVRCGVVAHPREWAWVGYHEILGHRRRYRLLDLDRLCWRLRTDSVTDLQENLMASLSERLARDAMKREAYWTKSLAVGSRGFVENVQPQIISRREMEIVAAKDGAWALQEQASPYG